MCFITKNGERMTDHLSKNLVVKARRTLHNINIVGIQSFELVVMFINKSVHNNYNHFSIQNIELFTTYYDLLDNIFKNINFHKTIQNIDIIGYIYEIYVKYGVCNYSKDYGQFFTNRMISKEIINLCDPKENESICDPAMGTGGLIIYYLQFMFNNKLKIGDIHGFDIDPFIITLGKINLNMYIPETNFIVQCQDTLLKGLPTKYDNIVANVPFGINKYSYDTCSSLIQKSNINCTRTEPLFIQLIINSLKENGKAVVIVPEIFLISSKNQYKHTRKFLLSKMNVLQIIKLSEKFFINTKCQPYILFFCNSLKHGDDTIVFSEIKKQDDTSLSKTTLGSILSSKVNTSSYSLHPMSYFTNDHSLSHSISNNHIIYPLTKVCRVFKGTRVKETGTLFPYIDVSCCYKKYVDDCTCMNPVVLTPSVCNIGKMLFMDQNCHPSDNMIIIQPIHENILCAKYLYYYSVFYISPLLQKYMYGVKPMITLNIFEKIKIIIPNIDLQNKIVSIMDDVVKKTKIEEMANFSNDWILKIMNDNGCDLANLRKNFILYEDTIRIQNDIKNYIDNKISVCLTTHTMYLIPLSEIVVLNPETAKEIDPINYIELSSVKNGHILERRSLSWDSRPKRAVRKVRTNDIIWGTVRPLSRSYAFIGPDDNDNTIVSSAFVVIRCTRPDLILPYYLYYCLMTQDFIVYLNNSCVGVYPTFDSKIILDYKIHVPSISWQKNFINRITHLKNIDNIFISTLSSLKSEYS